MDKPHGLNILLKETIFPKTLEAFFDLVISDYPPAILQDSSTPDKRQSSHIFQFVIWHHTTCLYLTRMTSHITRPITHPRTLIELKAGGPSMRPGLPTFALPKLRAVLIVLISAECQGAVVKVQSSSGGHVNVISSRWWRNAPRARWESMARESTEGMVNYLLFGVG